MIESVIDVCVDVERQLKIYTQVRVQLHYWHIAQLQVKLSISDFLTGDVECIMNSKHKWHGVLWKDLIRIKYKYLKNDIITKI